MSNNFNGRFKDSPWYECSRNEKILLCGVGGIGSNTLYNLSKTLPATYYIIDNDTVAEHNIGTQFFMKKDIGKSKVTALHELLNSMADVNIKTLNRKINDNDYMPITIAAFDNMDARRQLFNNWKTKEDRELFIDGRLRASFYEIFTVKKGDEDRYEKELFNDSDVKEDLCTYKQTSFFGMLIGARITNIIVNYISDKHNNTLAVVPYHIVELGELINVKIIN